MASVTYGKCIMANVIMAKIIMAKILWQMKLSQKETERFLKSWNVPSKERHLADKKNFVLSECIIFKYQLSKKMMIIFE